MGDRMATPIFPLVDRILKGRLLEFLRAQRQAGLSYQQIATLLHVDHDVSVTTETVRKWCLSNGITESEQPAGDAA